MIPAYPVLNYNGNAPVKVARSKSFGLSGHRCPPRMRVTPQQTLEVSFSLCRPLWLKPPCRGFETPWDLSSSLPDTHEVHFIGKRYTIALTWVDESLVGLIAERRTHLFFSFYALEFMFAWSLISFLLSLCVIKRSLILDYTYKNNCVEDKQNFECEPGSISVSKWSQDVLFDRCVKTSQR